VVVRQVLLSLEQAPALRLEQRLKAFANYSARRAGAHLVERLVQLGDRIEAIQDVQRLGQCLAMTSR